MKTTMITVIIPVYNAEKYLNKAAKSVLKQEIGNLELILVDDGSTDNSGHICDQLKARDMRVQVIHKENGGSSSARNAGLKAAMGSHISFLDADDFVDMQTYKRILEVIDQEDPDCIDFGWKYVSETGEISKNINKIPKNQVLNRDIIKNKIIPPLINLTKDEDYFVYDFSVNKIYKTDILRKYQILFDENRRTWEDRVFVVDYLKYCNSFYSLDQCFYNYVSVPNSLSRRYDPDFFQIILKNFAHYREMFEGEYDFEVPYVWNYWCHSIENMILRSLREKDGREEIERNIRDILQNRQVVKWYQLRKPESETERQISNLVKEQKTEQVLNIYKGIIRAERKREKLYQLKSTLRSLIKRNA